MRTLAAWIVAVGLVVSPVTAGTGRPGDDDSAKKTPSPVPAAETTQPIPASLENRLQQLRDLLEAQSRQFQAQNEQLKEQIQAQNEEMKEQQRRMQAIEEQLKTANPTLENGGMGFNGSSASHLVSRGIHIPSRADPPPSSDPYTFGAPSEGGVIPAIAPVRVLPIDIPRQGELIPDITLGSGAKMNLYGFFKMSAVETTAASGGAQFGIQDFPFTLLQGDTGPTKDSNFLIKDRDFRIGSRFEWVPKDSDVVITGRVETDFGGDYTSVNNRSRSSARNSQLVMRLAYVRLDTHLANLSVFAEFGQDWSIAGSSTLPNIFEKTVLMANFGNIYERIPQIKAGAQFGSGRLKVEPEFAIVWPDSADPGLTQLQRTGFGDRAGSESNVPGVEGRLVFQFPIATNWTGVAPAQVIFSGHHSSNAEIVTAGASPSVPISTTVNGGSSGLSATVIPGAACPNGGNSLLTCFPRGVQVNDPENMWTAEIQAPTPWVTFDGKYYNGANLRWFFGGVLNSVYPSPGPGLVTAGSATSFSGQTILFGCPNGLGLSDPHQMRRASHSWQP